MTPRATRQAPPGSWRPEKIGHARGVCSTERAAARRATAHPVGGNVLFVVLSRTLLGYFIVIPAFQRNPICLDVLAARQIVGPSVSGHQAGGFRDHVKLSVRLYFADEDGLGDMVIRQYLGDAAGQIRRLKTRKGRDHLLNIGRSSLLNRLY